MPGKFIVALSMMHATNEGIVRSSRRQSSPGIMVKLPMLLKSPLFGKLSLEIRDRMVEKESCCSFSRNLGFLQLSASI